MASASSHTCRPHSTSTYSNPVINQDFPDPNCITVADTFYVFATNFGELQASDSHVQLATTKDMVTFQLQPDALPKLPSWAKTGRTWAPNVTHVHTTDGSLFVLYFVAWDTQSDRQAIGVATSKNPEGPYQSHHPAPVILQVSLLAVQLGVTKSLAKQQITMYADLLCNLHMLPSPSTYAQADQADTTCITLTCRHGSRNSWGAECVQMIACDLHSSADLQCAMSCCVSHALPCSAAMHCDSETLLLCLHNSSCLPTAFHYSHTNAYTCICCHVTVRHALCHDVRNDFVCAYRLIKVGALTHQCSLTAMASNGCCSKMMEILWTSPHTSTYGL